MRNKVTEELTCTGFPPDHSTNTGNTIIRACSNHIGFPEPPTGQQQINVYILTATATHLGVQEVTDRASEQFHTVGFPQAYISAPSYDIYPGNTLSTLEIDGTGGSGDTQPLGLMLVTNSYRDAESTGAAIPESETVILPIGELSLPSEVTPDMVEFPVASVFDGPVCATWENSASCAVSRSGEHGFISDETFSLFSEDQAITRMYGAAENDESLLADAVRDSIHTRGAFDQILFETKQEPGEGEGGEEVSKCPETAVPRAVPLILNATENLTFYDPSTFETEKPLVTNTSAPSVPPTLPPAMNVTLTIQPSASPITPLPTPLALTMAPSSQPVSVTPTSPPVPTFQPTSARPTGPVSAAIVMYPPPSQSYQTGFAAENKFPASEAVQVSLSVPFGLGLLWQLLSSFL